MNTEAVSALMLAVLLGAGILLAAAGLLCIMLEKQKRRACTAKTQGNVVRYSFLNGAPCPVVEYSVNGKTYRKKRRFRAIVTKQRVMAPSDFDPKNSTLFIDENDVVHIKRGAILDLRGFAEEMYPIGSFLDVLYDPKKPQRGYVERIPRKLPITGPVLIASGAFVAVLGVLFSNLVKL